MIEWANDYRHHLDLRRDLEKKIQLHEALAYYLNRVEQAVLDCKMSMYSVIPKKY
jgi:hypothetical protein